MGLLQQAANWFKKGEKEPQFNEELADFVEKEFTRRQSERKPFELQWRLNLEFLNGNQYLDIDASTQTLQEIPKIAWYSEREVHNQLATIYETRLSRLTRQKPMMKTRPASNDDADLSSAKVSSMLINSSWHDQKMSKKYDEFVAWTESVGNCFYKTVWNKNKGRTIEQINPMAPGQLDLGQLGGNPQTPQMAPGEELEGLGELGFNGQEKTTMEGAEDTNPSVLREGDVETIVVSPFEVYPESAFHTDLESMKSIIHAKAMSLDDIESMWGVRVEAEDVDVMTLQQTKGSLGGIGYSVTSFRGVNRTLKDHAVVKEYYERPSKKYPEGRFIVVSSKKTLYSGPLPYRTGENNEPDLPFVHAVSIPKVGNFWGISTVERCIPIQRRYNALRNRKAEYLNLVAIGQWYEPDGSIDDDTELNNAPGNRIRFRAANGMKPEPVVFPNLPASFENEIATLNQEFTSISGVSELSRYSEAPSGVKSGVALSIANEQDDTRISMASSRIANASIELAKSWIRLYRQFAQEPRVLRHVGSDKEVEVKEWTASQLSSDDVIVENISALSETPAQRRQTVFDLIGTGIFNKEENNPYSPEGVAKILEMIEFGHWENGVNSDRRLHESRAKRENHQLMQGQLVQTRHYDDHVLHIEAHTRMRLKPEYEQLLQTEVGQIIDQLFEAHIAEHSQAVQQAHMMELQQQMQMQALMGGGQDVQREQ